MNYFERQEGYSWGIGCVFCLWMEKDESPVSEWKKTKMKGKNRFHFVSGEKKNEEKWVLGAEHYRAFTPKFNKRKGIVWV